MQPGFYKATFSTQLGGGAGVVFVEEGGRLLGGDSGFWWGGSYNIVNDQITAVLHVRQHDVRIGSVFGGITEAHLHLQGHATPNGASMKGTAREVPAANFTVVLSPLLA